MKRSTILGIIAALVISIAAIGCSSGSSGTQPTPTAVPTHTSAPTAAPTQVANGAATATSLDFIAQVTTQGDLYTYRYRARNIGTSSLDLRIDMSSSQMNAVYIVSGSTQHAWLYTSGQWMDMSQSFAQYWGTWNTSFYGYQTALAEKWTGLQGWTDTIPGVGTVTYTDITINPALSASLFQPN